MAKWWSALLKFDHERPWCFALAHENTWSWSRELPCKKSINSEATMPTGRPGHMGRPCTEHLAGYPGLVQSLNHVRGASLMAQIVKNLPAMQESWVWFLSGDPMDRGAWRATVHGTAELDATERLTYKPRYWTREWRGFKYGMPGLSNLPHKGSKLRGADVHPQFALSKFLTCRIYGYNQTEVASSIAIPAGIEFGVCIIMLFVHL